MLNKIILFVVNQYSVIMQRNCPWLFMFAEKFSNREAERNRPRPRIQRLPVTHLKRIERARSNQGNTVGQVCYDVLEMYLRHWLPYRFKRRTFQIMATSCLPS